MIDAQLGHAFAHGLDVPRVTEREAAHADVDARPSLRVSQARKPVLLLLCLANLYHERAYHAGYRLPPLPEMSCQHAIALDSVRSVGSTVTRRPGCFIRSRVVDEAGRACRARPIAARRTPAAVEASPEIMLHRSAGPEC